MKIICSDSLEELTPAQLSGGFFDGWPNVILAVDEESGNVIGFITAISDGVLPAYQGQGIGSELVRRMLEKLRLGMQPYTGMVYRNYESR